MDSTFEKHMSDANDELLDEFGEQITYTPSGGQAVQIKASVSPVEIEKEEDETGRNEIKRRTVTVALADISSPAISDMVTVDGEEYVVGMIANLNSGVAELAVVSAAVESRRHEMHKRKITE